MRMYSKKFISLLVAGAAIALMGQAEVILFDDFSQYAAGGVINNDNWRPKWESSESSQRDLFKAHTDGYAVLNGAAERGYNIPFQTGFTVGQGQSVKISTDIRYRYAGGGISDEINTKIFGIQLATESNWWDACKRADLSLANRGLAIGVTLPVDPWLEGWVMHQKLGVNVNNESLSKWFNIECTVFDNKGKLYGSITITGEGIPTFTSKAFDLGIETGTTVYPGFTTGWNELGTSILEHSRIAEVHLDNFKVSTEYSSIPLVKATPPPPKSMEPKLAALGLVM